MLKQSFNTAKKVLTILLAVLFVASLTVGAASACHLHGHQYYGGSACHTCSHGNCCNGISCHTCSSNGETVCPCHTCSHGQCCNGVSCHTCSSSGETVCES